MPSTLTGQKTFLQVQAELGGQILGTQGGTSPYWDSTTRPTLDEVKTLINDAYREVCSYRPWWFLYQEFTFQTVVGQTTPYDMDLTVEQVQYMTIPARQLKLSWMAMSDWRVIFPGGYTNMANMLPTFYIPAPPDATTNGLQFYIGPGPANEVYTIQYGAKLRIANMSANGDTPLIRPEWQDVYILLAKAKIFDWLGDMTRYQETMQRYQARLVEMWKFDQETEESSWRMRNAYDEMAYSPYTDVNRALFVPFGR
jgi:hypothetical protein